MELRPFKCSRSHPAGWYAVTIVIARSLHRCRGLLSLALLLLVSCAPTTLELRFEPRFTSFSPSYPSARAPEYPRGEWGSPEPALVSSYDYMLVFKPETLQRDHVVVQRVLLSGLENRICGGAAVPYAVEVLEYFRAPAHDVQAWWVRQPERTHFESRRGIVAYAALPGTPPPIHSGDQAALLGPQYLDSLSPADRQRLRPGRLDDATFLRWEHQYQYDGCHAAANAATGCGETHCLTLTWHEVEGGRRSSDHRSTYAGSGRRP